MPLYRFLLLFIFLIDDFIPISINPIVLTLITMSSSSFGPYQTFCSNQTIDININSNRRLYSSYLTVYAGLSESNYSYSRQYGSFNLAANGTKTQSIVLPTREYLTSNGMYIKLKLTYHDVMEGPDTEYTVSFAIQPIELNRNIKPEEHITDPFVIDNASYMLSNN